MLNDRSSTLALLKTRRSCRPRDLTAPGPTCEELRGMLEAALRTPDHGKLAPWRFVHISREARDAFAALLHRAWRRDNAEPTGPEVEAVERFARQAPELVVALSSPVSGTKIPIWEQELSCGAACMNLILAAHALGYAAGWVTGWAAYDRDVLAQLACEGERIAGFIFIGTPAVELQERPRPSLEAAVSKWAGRAAG